MLDNNNIFKIKLDSSNSVYLTFSNFKNCNLICSKGFYLFNSDEDIQKLKEHFTKSGYSLNIINDNEVDLDNFNEVLDHESLNITVLDGFNPKILQIHNYLIENDFNVNGIVTNSNNKFFEELNLVPEVLNEAKSKILSNKEELASKLKSFVESMVPQNLDFMELDISALDSDNSKLKRLLNSDGGIEGDLKKIISDITVDKDEESEILNFLSSYSFNSDKDLDSLDDYYLNFKKLSINTKRKLSRAIECLFIEYSNIFKRGLKNQDSLLNDSSNILEELIDDAIKLNSSENFNPNVEKSLADASLLISQLPDKSNYLKVSREGYKRFLDSSNLEKNSIVRLQILNNLGIINLKLFEIDNDEQFLNDSINYLNSVSEELDNKSEALNNFALNNNFGIAFFKRGVLKDSIEDYRASVDSLETAKNILIEQEYLDNYHELLIQLSFIYRKLGKDTNDKLSLEKSVEYSENSVNYYEKEVNNFKLTESLIELCLSVLSIYENFDSDNADNLKLAADSAEKAYSLIDKDKFSSENLSHLSKLADVFFKISEIENPEENIRKALDSYETVLSLNNNNFSSLELAHLNQKLGDSYRFITQFERDSENCLKAIDHYEQSLMFFNSNNYPDEYTKITLNTASTYEILSHLEFDIDYCQKAIDLYEGVLEFCDKEQSSEYYYSAINNLGNAYSNLAEFENKEDNSLKAIEYYNTFLDYKPHNKSGIEYAMIQNNLGVAYSTLAEDVKNEEHLVNAVSAFKESLNVYNLEEYPDNYAMIQNNLGDSYFTLSNITDNTEKLRNSIDSYENSINVYNKEDYPGKYGFIIRKLAKCYKKLYDKDSKEEFLAKSINANQESLDYFKYEDFPEENSIINLELGLSSLDNLDNSPKQLKKFIGYFKNSLNYFDVSSYPIHYSKITNNLGNLFRELSFFEDKEKNCRESIKYLEESLSVLSSNDALSHAIVFNNIGSSYAGLAEITDQKENLEKSITYFNDALEGITKDQDDDLFAALKNNLSNCLTLLSGFDNEFASIDSIIQNYDESIDLATNNFEKALINNNLLNSKSLFSSYEFNNEATNFDLSSADYKNLSKSISDNSQSSFYNLFFNNNAACHLLEVEFPNGKKEKLDHAKTFLDDSVSSFDMEKAEYPESVLNNNIGLYYLHKFNIQRDEENYSNSIEHLKKSINYSPDLQDKFPLISRKLNLANISKNNIERLQTAEEIENLIGLYESSLPVFNETGDEEVTASINFQLAELFTVLSNLKDDVSLLLKSNECFSKAAVFYGSDNYKYQKSYIDYKSGSNYLSLFDDNNNSDNLRQSVEYFSSALNVFTNDLFPELSAKIMTLSGNANYKLGKMESLPDNLLNSIDNFESALSFYDEKNYPEINSDISQSLDEAYSELLADESKLTSASQKIEYYSGLINGLQNRNNQIDITNINLKLAEAYSSQYDSEKNISDLQKSLDIQQEILSAINPKSETEKYYKQLLLVSDLKLKIGKETNNHDLILEKINNYDEALKFWNEKADIDNFIKLSQKNADSYYYLFSKSDEINYLENVIKHYSQINAVVDKSSHDSSEIEELYGGFRRELLDYHLSDKNHSKVIEIAEKELLLVDDEGSELYADLNLIIADSIREQSIQSYTKKSVLRSIDFYKKALDYFDVENHSEKNYVINKNIYDGLKILYENEKNDEYLTDCVSSLNNLVELTDEAMDKDKQDLEYENALLTLKNAEVESNKGDFSKAFDLCMKCLEFLSPENYPGKYAEAQKILGIVHYHISSTQYKVINLRASLSAFKESKKILSRDENYSESDISEINVYLEDIYNSLIEEEGKHDLESRISHLSDIAELFKDNEKYNQLPGVYFDLANTYQELAESNNDLDLYNKAVLSFENYIGYIDTNADLLKFADTKFRIGELHKNIFNISNDKESLAKSLESFNESVGNFRQLKKSDGIQKSLNSLLDVNIKLAEHEENQSELDKAVSYYEQALDHAVSLKDQPREDSLKIKLSDLLLKLADSNQNNADYIKIIDLINSVSSSFEDRFKLSSSLGYVYKKLHELNEGDEHLQKSIEKYTESLSHVGLVDQNKKTEIENILKDLNQVSMPIEEEIVEEVEEIVDLDLGNEINEIEEPIFEKPAVVSTVETESELVSEPEVQEEVDTNEVKTEFEFINKLKAMQENDKTNIFNNQDDIEKESDEKDSGLDEDVDNYIKTLEKELSQYSVSTAPDNYSEISLKTGLAYLNKAKSLNDLDSYFLAIKYFKNSLKVYNKDDSPFEFARVTKSTGDAYYDIANITNEIKYYRNAINNYRDSMNFYNSENDNFEYGHINKNIGLAYSKMAEHEAELKFYNESIIHYKNALEYIDKDSSYSDFALINKNLGIAYGVVSEIEKDYDALNKSIKCYLNALEIYDQNNDPDDFALITKYLGIAYGLLGEKENNIEYLIKSNESYSKSINYYRNKKNLNDFGLISRNVGNNYLKIVESDKKIQNFKAGIDAYNNALLHYSFEERPIVYASIKNNIGSLYTSLSNIENKVDNSKESIDAYSEVLKIYNINENPMEFAAANNNLGIAYSNLGEVEDKKDNCLMAIKCYEKSLKVYTYNSFPLQFSYTQNNLGNTYRNLSEEVSRVENLKKAIKCYDNALKVRTMENMPIQYAATQNNLGVSFRSLAEVESKEINCKNAIKSYESALLIYTEDNFPIQYATTKNNIAGAYSTLAEIEDKNKNFSSAIDSFRQAQRVFNKDDYSDIYNMIEENIIYLQDSINN